MNRILSVLISLVIIVSVIPVIHAGAYTADDTENIINSIIDYSKNRYSSSDSLLNSRLIDYAGTSEGDWYAIALSRYNASDDYGAYLTALQNRVGTAYGTADKLSGTKSTEWHRIIFAVLSCGGDPVNFQTSGGMINLVADGIYNRGFEVPLGNQGIPGLIWGLTALDSAHFSVPDGACDTRDGIIDSILSLQLDDGGFALTGESCDPDITANVLTALAPYRGQRDDVRNACERALDTLSSIQLEGGDFATFGSPNAESTAQVIIALTSCGIDIFSDGRFIKNGNTAFDGLLKYRREDGGFAHLESLPRSNDMATVQTMMALVSVYRFRTGQSAFYDFGQYTAPEITQMPEVTERTEENKEEKNTEAVSSEVLNQAEKSAVTESITGIVTTTTAAEKTSVTSSVSSTASAVSQTTVRTDFSTSPETSVDTSVFSETSVYKNDSQKNDSKNIVKIIILVAFVGTSAVVFIAFKNKKRIRNNIILVLAAVSAGAFILVSVNIKSADKYYQYTDDSEYTGTVTLTIEYLNIFNNTEKLDSNLSYLTETDGYIIREEEFGINEGDTVYDVLLRAVRENRLQMSYQGAADNSFGSVYIQSISNLAEFSCGELSGWIYTVNGDQAQTGCDKYVLSDGDTVKWSYTCDLGRDVK